MSGTFKLPLAQQGFDTLQPNPVAARFSGIGAFKQLLLNDRSSMPPPASLWRINTVNIPGYVVVANGLTVGTALSAGQLIISLYDNFDLFYSFTVDVGPAQAGASTSWFFPFNIYDDLRTPHDLLSGHNLTWQARVTNTDNQLHTYSVAMNAALDANNAIMSANGNLQYDELLYNAPTITEAAAG